MIASLSGPHKKYFQCYMKTTLSCRPMNSREIISRFGGPVSLSLKLGIRSQAVSLWASKGRIPMPRVPQLLRISRAMRLGLRAQDIRPDIDWEAL